MMLKEAMRGGLETLKSAEVGRDDDDDPAEGRSRGDDPGTPPDPDADGFSGDGRSGEPTCPNALCDSVPPAPPRPLAASSRPAALELEPLRSRVKLDGRANKGPKREAPA
jgi:hypothetical protein